MRTPIPSSGASGAGIGLAARPASVRDITHLVKILAAGLAAITL
jgi:hypothetical protein